MCSGSGRMSYPWWPSLTHSARQKTLVESLAWLRETRPPWIGLYQNILALCFCVCLPLSGRLVEHAAEERPTSWNRNHNILWRTKLLPRKILSLCFCVQSWIHMDVFVISDFCHESSIVPPPPSVLSTFLSAHYLLFVYKQKMNISA